MPGAVLLRDGADPWAERACEAAGLRHIVTSPVMLFDPLPASNPAAPPWLAIRRATSETAHAEHVRTDAVGFGAPPAINDRVFPRSLLGAPGYHAYTGYIDGQPIATSVLWRTGRVAGVYGVATLPGFRRRGVGAAMTRHAMAEGRALGCALAVLQASPMGRPVYDAMGFRLLTSYRIWVRATG